MYVTPKCVTGIFFHHTPARGNCPKLHIPQAKFSVCCPFLSFSLFFSPTLPPFSFLSVFHNSSSPSFYCCFSPHPSLAHRGPVTSPSKCQVISPSLFRICIYLFNKNYTPLDCFLKIKNPDCASLPSLDSQSQLSNEL